jgi:phage gp16-like protein
MKANSRTADLAKIHIARKALGLDDDTYRGAISLISHGRTDSSGELDHAERAALLDHFNARGWKNTPTAPDVASAKKKLISKIGALLTDMELSWAYADGIAKQMYKREKLQWCKPQELRGIIAALVKKQKANHAKD